MSKNPLSQKHDHHSKSPSPVARQHFYNGANRFNQYLAPAHKYVITRAKRTGILSRTYFSILRNALWKIRFFIDGTLIEVSGRTV